MISPGLASNMLPMYPADEAMLIGSIDAEILQGISGAYVNLHVWAG